MGGELNPSPGGESDKEFVTMFNSLHRLKKQTKSKTTKFVA